MNPKKSGKQRWAGQGYMRGGDDKNEKNPGTSKITTDILATEPVPPAQGILPPSSERFKSTVLLASNRHYPALHHPWGAEGLGHPSDSTGVKLRPPPGAVPA